MDMPLSVVLEKLLSYKNFVHAVAGATGGFTAMSVFYPLDTIRTLLQVDDGTKSKTILAVAKEILEDQGVPGLYKGWFPVIASLWCSNFVYFYSYNFLKLVMYGETTPKPWKDLTAASIAGVINVLITTPMWVVNTRLKLQGSKRLSSVESCQRVKYKGIIDCFKRISKYEGIGALWNGTLPSLLLVCNPTIQFVVYEALKRHFTELFQTTELGAGMLFLTGAVAKAVATVLTYPVQVLQSRLRAQQRSGTQSFSHGLLECFNHIRRSYGVKGFYKGIEAKLLQTILMAALMFLTYEKISRVVFKIMIPKRSVLN